MLIIEMEKITYLDGEGVLDAVQGFPQVVYLSTIHGPNYLVISAKARQEFLSAIQEAMNMEIVILQREDMLLNWQ
nr:hypothetical protein CFP56_60458 [Quercus suber]